MKESFYILAGISRPKVLCLRGGIVPSDLFIRAVHLRHVSYCVHRGQSMKTVYVGRQYMKILFLRVVSCSPFSQIYQETF